MGGGGGGDCVGGGVAGRNKNKKIKKLRSVK